MEELGGIAKKEDILDASETMLVAKIEKYVAQIITKIIHLVETENIKSIEELNSYVQKKLLT